MMDAVAISRIPGNFCFTETPGTKHRFSQDLTPGNHRVSKILGKNLSRFRITCNKIPPKSIIFQNTRGLQCLAFNMPGWIYTQKRTWPTQKRAWPAWPPGKVGVFWIIFDHRLKQSTIPGNAGYRYPEIRSVSWGWAHISRYRYELTLGHCNRMITMMKINPQLCFMASGLIRKDHRYEIESGRNPEQRSLGAGRNLAAFIFCGGV